MGSNIDYVGLTINTKDGQEKEIPLEIWQVGVIAKILGLCVKPPNFNNYQMSSKKNIDEHMVLYYSAIKNINSKNKNK